MRARIRKHCDAAPSKFLVLAVTSAVTGLADDLLIVAGEPADVYFLESKRAKATLRARQDLMRRALLRLGAKVRTLHTLDQVDAFFAGLAV